MRSNTPLNLNKRKRLHGLENAIARDKRITFFQQKLDEGLDSLTIATLAKGTGLYAKATNVNDVAATILRLLSRGKLNRCSK